jgi:hypothetical protein
MRRLSTEELNLDELVRGFRHQARVRMARRQRELPKLVREEEVRMKRARNVAEVLVNCHGRRPEAPDTRAASNQRAERCAALLRAALSPREADELQTHLVGTTEPSTPAERKRRQRAWAKLHAYAAANRVSPSHFDW